MVQNPLFFVPEVPRGTSEAPIRPIPKGNGDDPTRFDLVLGHSSEPGEVWLCFTFFSAVPRYEHNKTGSILINSLCLSNGGKVCPGWDGRDGDPLDGDPWDEVAFPSPSPESQGLQSRCCN